MYFNFKFILWITLIFHFLSYECIACKVDMHGIELSSYARNLFFRRGFLNDPSSKLKIVMKATDVLKTLWWDDTDRMASYRWTAFMYLEDANSNIVDERSSRVRITRNLKKDVSEPDSDEFESLPDKVFKNLINGFFEGNYYEIRGFCEK